MKTREFYDEYSPTTLDKTFLDDLRSCIISHPHFSWIMDKILNHVVMGDPKRILLILGASGTGKSTLSRAANSTIAKWTAAKDDVSPPVWLEAPPPEGSSYSFRPFYEELLHGMKEPLPGYKIDPAEARQRRQKRKGRRAIRSTSGARQYVTSELRNMSIPAILVDEAQHFGRSANPTERVDAMDVIKSITELNKTKMVFFGTHEARKLEHLNGQLSRRVKTVHFMPYDLDEDGHKAFFSTFVSICTEVRMPIRLGREHIQFLHDNTLGAVGLLCQWLDDAAQEAIGNKDKIITVDHLAETTPEAITLDLIRKESADYRKQHGVRHRRIKKQLNKAMRRSRPGRRKPKARDAAGGAL